VLIVVRRAACQQGIGQRTVGKRIWKAGQANLTRYWAGEPKRRLTPRFQAPPLRGVVVTHPWDQRSQPSTAARAEPRGRTGRRRCLGSRLAPDAADRPRNRADARQRARGIRPVARWPRKIFAASGGRHFNSCPGWFMIGNPRNKVPATFLPTPVRAPRERRTV